MSMLPSQDPQMPQVEALFVVCVPSAGAGSYFASHCLGAKVEATYPLLQPLKSTPGRNITLLIQVSNSIEDTVLEAADGLMLILDAELGLDPHSISVWSKAADMSLPRHIGAVHVATGRADFDELIAIATRVLEPDLMVRYLPIDSEHDDTIVGQYDLLTADIHDCSGGVPVIRHGDPEHVALTADRRDDLFEELAHAGLADDAFDTHLQGMPVSIPALTDAWTNEHIVSITALDNQAGVHILDEWFASVPTRWIPVVTEDSYATSAADSRSPVGVGIGTGVGRMWASAVQSGTLEIVVGEKVKPVVVQSQTSGCLIAEGIEPEATIRLVGSAALVSVPRF
jgi:hypothetical protein